MRHPLMWPYALSLSLASQVVSWAVWDRAMLLGFASIAGHVTVGELYVRLAHDQLESTQRQLKATQEALLEAEKRAAVGLLSAGVAHELNSPLSAIVMNSHLLRMPGVPPQEVARCVDVIEKATDRAKEMVHALLSYARPAAQHSTGEPGRAIADCLLLMHHVLKPVVVETPALSFVPPVSMTTGELIRVLVNLLQNARHAVAERLTEAHIKVTMEVSPARVIMRVIDNGTGIAPRVLDRIWEPFFTTKPAGVGVGLGLSLVRSLVEQAGGGIAVESTGPEGTVFRFELPRADVR